MAFLSPPTPRHHGRSGRTRSASGQRRLFGYFLLLFLAGGLTGLRAQSAPTKEYQIKALFLFNFIQFVEWPASAFADARAPIRIGVLGADPFGNALEAAVQDETIRQRKIVIVRSDRIADVKNCQMVFVSRSERARMTAIISAFTWAPVLTVGDMPEFAERGGVLNFFLDGQKVRFEINRAAAQFSGLKLSSQMLSLARIIGPTPVKATP
jgi:hypothetical protein